MNITLHLLPSGHVVVSVERHNLTAFLQVVGSVAEHLYALQKPKIHSKKLFMQVYTQIHTQMCIADTMNFWEL